MKHSVTQRVTQSKNRFKSVIFISMVMMSTVLLAEEEKRGVPEVTEAAAVSEPALSDTETDTETVSAAGQAETEGKTLKELILEEDKTSGEETTEGEKQFKSQPEGPSLMQEGVKTIGMLLLLLAGFWWFSNWLKKSGKLARMSGGQGNIECLSVYSVGQKEKVALFKVRGEEILVGITQHSIQTLHHFPNPDSVKAASGFIEDKDDPSETAFSKALDSAERGRTS